MFRGKSLKSYVIQALLLVLFIQNNVSKAKKITIHKCETPSCGHIHNISYPFRLKGQPQECGEPKYELLCENNKTVILLHSVKYYVESINREDHTIRLVDSGIHCSSLPLHYSLTPNTFSGQRPESSYLQDLIFRSPDFSSNSEIIFLICEKPLHNSSMFISTQPCINGSILAKKRSYSSSRHYHSYVASKDVMVSDLEESCLVDFVRRRVLELLMWNLFVLF